jgi:hypothetical protein
MSLFDYYRPKSEQRCPVCARVLREWQGKDGPNGLFLWAEGAPFPVEQRVTEDERVEPAARERLRLPARFVIYSYDCPDHQPIEAEGLAPEGVWVETSVRPYAGASRKG